jgi:excisionase family DNA binding protein
MSMHLTTAQAAQSAGVSRWTVTRAIKAGELRAIRDNKGHLLIAPEDLLAWRSTPSAPSAHGAHRVQEHDSKELAPVSAPSAPQDAPDDSALRIEIATLTEKLVAAEAALIRECEASARERILVHDLQVRLDRAEEERRTALLALDEERRTLRTLVERVMAPAPEPIPTPERRRGILARLLGV